MMIRRAELLKKRNLTEDEKQEVKNLEEAMDHIYEKSLL